MILLPKFFDLEQGSAISLRPYGEPVRLHTRTQSKNSRQDQGGSYARSYAAHLSRVWALGLGNGGWFRNHSLAQECLEERPHFRLTLCRPRLYDLRKHSVFQLGSIRVCV